MLVTPAGLGGRRVGVAGVGVGAGAGEARVVVAAWVVPIVGAAVRKRRHNEKCEHQLPSTAGMANGNHVVAG